MAKAGRALELVVARLERILSADDVLMASPAQLAGHSSGIDREVDVALKAKVGSTEVLVIIECRDRKGNEDVQWIDELAGKRDDVQASRAVAVSSSGFSPAAITSAGNRGIELRTIEQVTKEALASWLSASVVHSTYDRFAVDECKMMLMGVAHPLPELGGTFRDKAIRRVADGVLVSGAELLDSVPTRPIFTSVLGLLPSGTSQVIRLTYQYFEGVLACDLPDGRVATVKQVVLSGRVARYLIEATLNETYAYTAAGKALVQGAQGRATVEDEELVFRIERTMEPGSDGLVGNYLSVDSADGPRYPSGAQMTFTDQATGKQRVGRLPELVDVVVEPEVVKVEPISWLSAPLNKRCPCGGPNLFGTCHGAMWPVDMLFFPPYRR